MMLPLLVVLVLVLVIIICVSHAHLRFLRPHNLCAGRRS